MGMRRAQLQDAVAITRTRNSAEDTRLMRVD